MYPWLPKTLCLLMLPACALLAHAQAQTPIYHCIGAHGEPVFSGRPCGAPAPTTSITGVPGTGTISRSNGFGDVCPASPWALRQAIAGAFEAHDVNRLAGLILWRDLDQASARARLRSLDDWVRQPLAGIAIVHAAGPPLAGAGPPPAASIGNQGGAAAAWPPSGFEISTGGGNGSTRDFGVTELGGCWWLTFD